MDDSPVVVLSQPSLLSHSAEQDTDFLMQEDSGRSSIIIHLIELTVVCVIDS